MKKILIGFFAGFLFCIFLIFIMNFYFGNFSVTGFTSLEKIPSLRLDENKILLYNDKIILEIANATISTYENTGSMSPLLDSGAHGIRVVPINEKEINVGDIISFRKNGELIVHRVIEKGEDQDGIYFITKGDKNFFNDGKIRFKDIEYITVGILW